MSAPAQQLLMKCLRCGVVLEFYGRVDYGSYNRYHMNPVLSTNVFVCPQCGHVENFLPPEIMEQARERDQNSNA